MKKKISRYKKGNKNMFHVPLSQKYWRHTVLARHATQQNVVGESKNMKHVNIPWIPQNRVHSTSHNFLKQVFRIFS